MCPQSAADGGVRCGGRGCSRTRRIQAGACRRLINRPIYSADVAFRRRAGSRGGACLHKRDRFHSARRLRARPPEVTRELRLSEGNRTEGKAAAGRAAREGHFSLRPSSLFIWGIRRMGGTGASPQRLMIFTQKGAGWCTGGAGGGFNPAGMFPVWLRR